MVAKIDQYRPPPSPKTEGPRTLFAKPSANTVYCLLEGGEEGYRNPPIRAIFWPKSVDPPLFSFKSGSALRKVILWYTFIAMKGKCLFLFST